MLEAPSSLPVVPARAARGHALVVPDARADVAVERVSASREAITFTVVNHGQRKAGARTLRARLRGERSGDRRAGPAAGAEGRAHAGATGCGWCRCRRGRGAPRCAWCRGRIATTARVGNAADVRPGAADEAAAARDRDADGHGRAGADRDRVAPTATAEPSPSATATATPTAAPASTPVAPADPRDAATAFRQNPAHDGRAFGDGPQPPLTTAWTRDFDGNLNYPLIAGGRVFAVTDKGMLRVLDLRSGALLWSNAVGQQPITAGYDDGRVFTTDRDGMTIAFDAASGLVLWSRGTNAESPPVADGGRVYVGGGAGLAVYDAATGALLREQQGRRGGW